MHEISVSTKPASTHSTFVAADILLLWSRQQYEQRRRGIDYIYLAPHLMLCGCDALIHFLAAQVRGVDACERTITAVRASAVRIQIRLLNYQQQQQKKQLLQPPRVFSSRMCVWLIYELIHTIYIARCVAVCKIYDRT